MKSRVWQAWLVVWLLGDSGGSPGDSSLGIVPITSVGDSFQLHRIWQCPANDLLDDEAITSTQVLIPEAIEHLTAYAC
eukprot:2022605-Heterocapsa_arctica.AAC.1